MGLELDSGLRRAFDTLEKAGDARRRGLLFEDLIVDLFRANHFEVRKDPRVARPRQTDLLATKVGDTYLVECKWRSTKADIDDIDSLRSRLRRTSGAIGLLVSVPGFSGTAISEVSDHRHQPILLLSGDELRRLVDRPTELTKLLWRKREALQIEGQAVVDEPPRRRRKSRRQALPDSPTRLVAIGRERSSAIEFGGGFGQFTFTHELVDIDWVTAAGSGVALDVPVPTLSEHGVLDLIDKLADLGWASTDARWSIRQSKIGWHGFGAAAFAAELPRWSERAARPDSHHSEEFCYLDNCTGGFYTLTSTISAERSRWATNTVLSFQLQGIPLDTAPLLQLCRSIGAHDGLYFRPLTKKSASTFHVPEWMSTVAQPYAFVVTPGSQDDSGSEWVTGTVLPNPFRDPRWRADPERSDADLWELEESEFLVCRLADYHPADDGRKYVYRLERINKTGTSEGRVYEPVARWDYANGEVPDSEQDLVPRLIGPRD